MQVGGKGTPGGAMHNNSDDTMSGMLTMLNAVLVGFHLTFLTHLRDNDYN